MSFLAELKRRNVLRVAAAYVVAAWLFAEEKRGAPVPGRLIAFGLFIISIGLLMAQPDFGQSVLLTLIFGGVFFASGLSWLWVAILGGLALLGALGIRRRKQR